MALDVPPNVQAFNFWTLLVMTKLWEEFPVPLNDFKPAEVAGALQVASSELPPVELFGPTVNWLLDEGFIRAKKHPSLDVYVKMVLTSKGFSVLNEVPRAIAPKDTERQKTLSALMREAMVTKGTDLAAKLIGAMLKP